MLFGTGRRFSGLFATHPPLTERIKAIDPSFTESDYPAVRPRSLSDTMAEDAPPAMVAPGDAAAVASIANDLPETVVETAGNPDPEHVAYAQQLRASIPDSLYDAAHSIELAFLLVVALIIERSGDSMDRQLGIAEEQLGKERAAVIARLHDELAGTRPEFRLVLLEIAFPALKLRPDAQLEYLVKLASRLIDVDGKVDLYEYCFYRVLRTSLGQAMDPSAEARPRRASRRELREAAIGLLTVIADYGHEREARARQAFDAGKAIFGKWAQKHTYESRGTASLPTLDHSLDLPDGAEW